MSKKSALTVAAITAVLVAFAAGTSTGQGRGGGAFLNPIPSRLTTTRDGDLSSTVRA
jgi:hypothetical protein